MSRFTRRFAAPAIATVVLLAAADAGAATRQHYGGVTSADDPFTLQVSRDGKRAVAAHVMLRGTCNDGKSISWTGRIGFVRDTAGTGFGQAAVEGARIARSGRFGGAGEGSGMYGPDIAGTAALDLRGRIRKSGTAAGTMSADIVLAGPQGVVATCASEEVRWSARSRRGIVYAGTTDSGLPVVAMLNRARTMVADLRFGWSAVCDPDGGIMLGDHLGNFRLTGGRFGETFASPDIPLDDGTLVRFEYTVDGGVTPTSASGSVLAKLLNLDGAGAVLRTCDGGTIEWTARSG